ncbi:unnamed protein product, partial [Staurois parvus]
ILHFQGRGLYVNTDLSRQYEQAALYCSAQQSNTEQLVCIIKHSTLLKHSRHTVNPLIAPHINPFLPSAISTVSVLFISTAHCIAVTGDVSDTKSVPPPPPPSVRMPAAVLL